MTRIAPALPLFAVLIALLGAPAADARVTVRVVSPKADSVTVGKAVTVRVKVAGKVRRFRAALYRPRGARQVGGRFKRVRPRMWRARLRVGRDLRPGQNHLYVYVRRPNGRDSVDAVHFVMATRRGDLVRRLPAAGSGPLGASIRLRRGADFRARLNGRRVRRVFEGSDGRVWQADLRPRDGLRYGVNRLRIVAFDESGRYEVLRQRRVLRRVRPLADAGRDRKVHPRSVIRLNGTASRPRDATRLRYRWRIVSRPKGSRARLVGRNRARPRLVRAKPGHYRIRLRVSHAPRRGRRAAAAASSSDSVTISVQQPYGPAGVPVKTIVDTNKPGIQVGSKFYPGSPGLGQILILDRDTLTPTKVTDATQLFAIEDTAEVLGFVAEAITDAQLLIVAGSGEPMHGSPDKVTPLEDALAAFGSVGNDAAVNALIAGQYTLIGVPGLPQGTATESIAAQQGNLPRGGVEGTFVTDIHSNYSFKWPASFNTFDTQAPGSTKTRNIVSVNGQTYASENVNEHGGWHLVWLNGDDLRLRGNFTFQNQCCLHDLLAQLRAIANDPVPGLIFLSTVGALDPDFASNETEGGLQQIIGWFGGNEAAWAEWGQYTLVGLAGLGANGPNKGLDLNQNVAHSPSSRIVGVLRRNDQGLWQGGTNGTPAPTEPPTLWQPQLQKILAQPAQPFPTFSSAGERAAFDYITAGVNLPANLTPSGLRALYWTDDDIIWSDKVALLEGLAPCTRSPCSGSFADVKRTLAAEWDDVGTVRDYFTGGESTDLGGLYQDTFDDSTLGFVAITADVMSAYPSPPRRPASAPSWLNILDSTLTLAQGMTGFLPIVGDEVTNALAVAQGAEEIYGAVTTTKGGAPALDPAVFEGDIYTFGTDLENAWKSQIRSLSTVADLLVSDAGRLSAAADEIGTPAKPGGWGLDTKTSSPITESLGASIAGYIWQSMLPVSTNVYTCIVNQRVPGTPARDQSFIAYFTSENAGNQGGPPYQVSSSWAYLARKGAPTDWPSNSVLNTLFGKNTDKNQLGLQYQYFMMWGARTPWGDPNGAVAQPGTPGFNWVNESRHDGACKAGEP